MIFSSSLNQLPLDEDLTQMNLHIKLLTEKLISQMFSNYKITWSFVEAFRKTINMDKT